MQRDTRLQHHGDGGPLYSGSVSPPIFRSSLFTFPDCASFEEALRGEGDRFIYSRVSNPTVRVLEGKVVDLGASDDSIAVASCMGAITAVLLSFLSSGDHLVCLSRAYAPALSFIRGLLRRMGVSVTFLETADVGRLADIVTDGTR